MLTKQIIIEMSEHQAALIQYKERQYNITEKQYNIAKGNLDQAIELIIASEMNPEKVIGCQIVFDKSKITITPPPEPRENDRHSGDTTDNIRGKSNRDNSNPNNKQKPKREIKGTQKTVRGNK